MLNFVPLNSNKHRNMRFTPASDFKFARQISEIDITLSEIWPLSSFFPIVFSRRLQESHDVFFPIVVIGKPNQANNLVSKDGSIKLSAIPSLLRTYPFLIKNLAKDKTQIFVDENSSYFSKTGRVPLFSEDGVYTAEAKNILAVLRVVADELREAQKLGSIASRLGLLKSAGDAFAGNEYFYLDLDLLNQLTDSTALMLHDRHWLQLLYAIALSTFYHLKH